MYITDKNKFNNVKKIYIIEEGMGQPGQRPLGEKHS